MTWLLTVFYFDLGKLFCFGVDLFRKPSNSVCGSRPCRSSFSRLARSLRRQPASRPLPAVRSCFLRPSVTQPPSFPLSRVWRPRAPLLWTACSYAQNPQVEACALSVAVLGVGKLRLSEVTGGGGGGGLTRKASRPRGVSQQNARSRAGRGEATRGQRAALPARRELPPETESFRTRAWTSGLWNWEKTNFCR